MNAQIKVGIVGYGNLGRGVEAAIAQNPDMHLEAVFTRRDPASIDSKARVERYADLEKYRGQIDVLILCGGSATDLPEQGPQLAAMFNTVDSYDTHARIPEYYAKMDQAARTNGKVSLISTGWDPGLFSLNRVLFEAILPNGDTYTFWGKGVSQGHSDAVRRVPGVKYGVQYTIPNEQAVDRIRSGERPQLTTRERHIRECYIVPEPGADQEAIREAIVTMPHYFADYDTKVHFISEEEMKRDHGAMPHGGIVIRAGNTGHDTAQVAEFKIKLDSNPEFTSSVLVAYARAVYRLAKEGQVGAKTVFDIPIGYLSPKSPEDLRKELL
ncbi:meso-diaminopimelate D-dehydrogenase [Insulibacter thermoxylanivorax]|uniref:Meso-diaminopimelate D-dehydrogenase n=1 Tax=Insulibacter thermoxylanivorax TaxID=2749268 RepID=A0A916QAC4_9BACL|nr:diaminopimelate dehydrogenase [Insulibacter thermoxylanivorax]GFR37050.1 meso-diaminopimelate D-dehydrogenase [Insulibacter thermoxylanivorax]